jgi:hypothetical protein
MLIGPDGRPGAAEPSPETESAPAREERAALRDWIGIALICVSCWLAIGLVVLAALMLGSGWMTPLLVAVALLAGAGVTLFPVVLYREKARAAESALQALIAEAPEQALLDAAARESELFTRAEHLDLLKRARRRAD